MSKQPIKRNSPTTRSFHGFREKGTTGDVLVKASVKLTLDDRHISESIFGTQYGNTFPYKKIFTHRICIKHIFSQMLHFMLSTKIRECIYIVD